MDNNRLFQAHELFGRLACQAGLAPVQDLSEGTVIIHTPSGSFDLLEYINCLGLIHEDTSKLIEDNGTRPFSALDKDQKVHQQWPLS